jgi:glycine cleavage system H protein
MQDNIKFSEQMWLNIDDDIVTVGLLEDAAEDLTDEINLNLPEEDDVVLRGKVCGYIETDNGNINLYSPVSGTVVELNEAVLGNPDLIVEDPTDEGWLFRVEAEDPSQLEKYTKNKSYASDEDEDEDENEDEDEDDDAYDDDGSEDSESDKD